jgi:two-component system sensor histidine kinase BaeS
MHRFNSLWVRLSLAFLLVTWGAIGTVALIVQNATEANFESYVRQQNTVRYGTDLIDDLKSFYAANESWDGAGEILPSSGQRGNGQGRTGGTEQRGTQFVVGSPQGQVVASTDETLVGSSMNSATQNGAVPIEVDGKTVGLLGQVTPGTTAIVNAETRFLDQTTRWLLLAVAGAGIIAVVIGVVLAWQLTRPLHRLTAAVNDLSTGKLGRQVKVGGSAEMADLAEAFNRMSHDLHAGEQLRQRMAADVAHELRSPVSVLRGHLEAMLDGVFPLDSAHLAVPYDQTIHLSRLVDDLRLLTMAEAGRLPLERVVMPPGELVSRAADLFAPLAIDAEITLDREIEEGLPLVLVDVDRMQQVFANLLSNALRHTPQGGSINIQLKRHARSVRFAVQNTGDTLDPEQLAHIFDRFWRADDARERDKGGSGLGLAITRQLVELHGGRIWAESASGQVVFTIELPSVTG